MHIFASGRGGGRCRSCCRQRKLRDTKEDASAVTVQVGPTLRRRIVL
jgi:hypothetical protein